MARDVHCPYCCNPADYIDSAAVYDGRSFGMVYACLPCAAWVGVHKGTDKPLGRLANKELREWKRKAHAAFDPIWRAKLALRRHQRGPEYKVFYARGSAYKWLSEQLGIESKDCHIGMFDAEQCRRVVEICEPYKKRIEEKGFNFDER